MKIELYKLKDHQSGMEFLGFSIPNCNEYFYIVCPHQFGFLHQYSKANWYTKKQKPKKL